MSTLTLIRRRNFIRLSYGISIGSTNDLLGTATAKVRSRNSRPAHCVSLPPKLSSRLCGADLRSQHDVIDCHERRRCSALDRTHGRGHNGTHVRSIQRIPRLPRRVTLDRHRGPRVRALGSRACPFAYPSPHSPYTHAKADRGQTKLPGATRTTQPPTGPSDATVPVAKLH
jgi:hypothetical protein